MRKVWTIARHEYLTNLRRTGFIVWTLAVPFIGLLVLLVAAFAGGQASRFLEQQFLPQEVRVGFVDRSGLFFAVRPEYASQFLAYTDEVQGQADVVGGVIDALLVIPPDYLESGRVTMIMRSNVNLAVTEKVDDFLAEHLLHGRLDAALVERVLNPLKNADLITLTEEGKEGLPGGGGLTGMIVNTTAPYILGVLLATTIFSSSGYLLRSVAEEKTNRVIEVLLSSVNAQQLLAGKVIGLGALGLTQVAFWLASSFALSGGSLGLLGIAIPLFMRPHLFLFSVVYYLLGYALYAVLMSTAGALGTTQQEAQQIGGLFSLMASLPLVIVGFVFSNPNAMVARVFSWIPLTAPVMMVLRLTLGEIPLVDIVISIAGCLIAIPLAIWIGAKIFRTTLLMYGKRLSLREAIHLLRAA